MQPKKFVIHKTPSSAPVPSYYQPPAPHEPDGHGCLCFFLGALFGPFGLLLAAIVGKAGGLVKALIGFVLVWLPLMGLAWWLMFGAPSASEQKHRSRIDRENAELRDRAARGGILGTPDGR